MAAPQTALRNAGWLLAQRVLHILGAALFAMLVPRLMGPADFGRFSLLVSVSLWFALLSGLGAVSLIARSVPQLAAEEDRPALSKLATNLLVVRAGTGLLAGAAYFALVALTFGELDHVAAAMVAGAVFARSTANLCFALFLGLNRAATWGMGDLMRRGLALLFVLAGYLTAGLRGACTGYLIAELLVLAVGLLLARGYIRFSLLDLTRRYLGPFLRISTAFAAGNLLLTLAHRSGETLVRVTTGDFTEVGYFSAAYAVYLTGGHALWQLAISFAPVLVAELHGGRPENVARWLGRLFTVMTVLAMGSLLVVVGLAREAVPLVLGAAYHPVAANLVPLTLTLLPLAAANIGRLAALTVDRPRAFAVAAGLEMVTFWTAGAWLVSRFGGYGACVAVLVATTVNAASMRWSLRGEPAGDLRRPLYTALLAAPFLIVVTLGSGWTAVLLVLGSLTAYGALLLALRVVAPEHVAELPALFRQRAAEPPPQVDV